MERDPTTVSLTLTGWKAAVAIVVVAGVFLWRVAYAHASLGPELESQLRFWLRGEYQCAIQAAEERGDPLAKRYDRFDPAITLDTVGVRGTNPVYVRAEIRVDGKDPPDGRRVRYFIFEHSLLLGWRYQRDGGPLSYWLRLY